MGMTARKMLSPTRTIALPLKADKPAKANLRFPGLVQHRGFTEEVRDKYLPTVANLCDHDLLAELNYWLGRVRKERGEPYKKGTAQQEFLGKMLKMQFFFNQRRGLDGRERRNIINACVALRSRLVPRGEILLEAPPKGLTEVQRLWRQLDLRFESDWELVQRLTSCVGTSTLSGREMEFIAKESASASCQGRDMFVWSSKDTRDKAEKLLVDLDSRPVVLRLDQVTTFKKMLGVARVIVWGPDPYQPYLFVK